MRTAKLKGGVPFQTEPGLERVSAKPGVFKPATESDASATVGWTSRARAHTPSGAACLSVSERYRSFCRAVVQTRRVDVLFLILKFFLKKMY